MSARALLAAGYKHPYNLKAVIDGLGLSANLKLCLDSGDGLSYTSGQKWLDVSGNGYDFFRGVDVNASTDDPTFNGTPNLHSSNEYFSYDGGDFFTYDSANETWMQNLHKDNAKFCIAAFGFMGTVTSIQGILGTGYSTGTDVGINYWVQNTGGGHNLWVFNGTGGAALGTGAIGTALTASSWNFFGLTHDEGAAAGSVFSRTSGSLLTTSYTSTYSSPSAANATFTAAIGKRDTGQSPSSNGSRLACLAIWEGVAHSAATLGQLHTLMRGRFGL